MAYLFQSSCKVGIVSGGQPLFLRSSCELRHSLFLLGPLLSHLYKFVDFMLAVLFSTNVSSCRLKARLDLSSCSNDHRDTSIHLSQLPSLQLMAVCVSS
jgi:hypothetical protein